MPSIGAANVEKEITLHDNLEFIEKQDVEPGTTPTRDNWAYKIEGPEGYVVFVQAQTVFNPEFRTESGEPLDSSTRVRFQKCDKQGNPISEYVLSELLGRWNYTKMRSDPDYFRQTRRDLILDEREIAKIFVEIPDSADSGFDSEQSRLTIGDTTSNHGRPAEIVDHDDLTGEESAAVKMASQRNGG